MPRPSVQILVCVNERPPGAAKPCCGRRGALALYRRFKDEVRERGLRDRVMVTRTGCLKHCSLGITVAVQPANLWYAGVTPDDVAELVEASAESREVERLRMPDVPWE